MDNNFNLQDARVYTIEGHEGLWTLKDLKITGIGVLLACFKSTTSSATLNINLGFFEDALKKRNQN